jgi:tetratricopeptide (TPR) repeat protein
MDARTLDLASNAYENSGNTPEAVSTLRQAILLDPGNINYYLDFATLCLAHQSFQAGIDVISDGMRVQPSASQLYLVRGVLYVQRRTMTRQKPIVLAHKSWTLTNL